MVRSRNLCGCRRTFPCRSLSRRGGCGGYGYLPIAVQPLEIVQASSRFVRFLYLFHVVLLFKTRLSLRMQCKTATLCKLVISPRDVRINSLSAKRTKCAKESICNGMFVVHVPAMSGDPVFRVPRLPFRMFGAQTIITLDSIHTLHSIAKACRAAVAPRPEPGTSVDRLLRRGPVPRYFRPADPVRSGLVGRHQAAARPCSWHSSP